MVPEAVTIKSYIKDFIILIKVTTEDYILH